MRCPFCQNHSIAHPDGPIGEYKIAPHKLAETARNSSLRSVAYTYNEPSLQAEYIFAASSLLRDEGIATVMVTNGMFGEEVCREAAGAVDAMNVDVKSFDEDSYQKLGGSLDVVKRNVEFLVDGGVHVELTSLVVPGISDSPDGFAEMIAWIAKVSPDIPLHISRYFPAYRYNEPPTDISLIEKLLNIARNRLKYVYTGNI
jgi:pyruvate formate lyase activating enzyme